MTEKYEYSNHLADHFFRLSYASMVSFLVRYYGLAQVELAEDIVQDTLVEAMEKWSIKGIPDNPLGWMMDVAKKKTINTLKRQHNFKTRIAPHLEKEAIGEHDNIIADSTLRMIFACCHPALPVKSQIALALKTLCGLSVKEIALALFITEDNISKRLYRAKQTFRKGLVALKFPPFMN